MNEQTDSVIDQITYSMHSAHNMQTIQHRTQTMQQTNLKYLHKLSCMKAIVEFILK